MRCVINLPDHTLNLSETTHTHCEQNLTWQAYADALSNMLTLSHMQEDTDTVCIYIFVQQCKCWSISPWPYSRCRGALVAHLFLLRKGCSERSQPPVCSVDAPLGTYPVVPVWSLLPRRWFSPGQPRTSHPGRKCLPELCTAVHPTPLEPCRSQSHRWRKSAAWSDRHPQDLYSSCSNQSLPPTGWTRRCIKIIIINVLKKVFFPQMYDVRHPPSQKSM